MSTKTLTRDAGHDLVDAAEQLGALAQLAEGWDVPGHWNDYAAQWDVGALHDYVDDACLSDESRANGPQPDDDTGLPDVELL